MGFAAADFLPLVIEKVNPEVTKAFEESYVFIKKIMKGQPLETNNRGVRLVSRVRQNPKMAWYDSDGGQLPPDGKSTYVDMRVFFANEVIAGGFTKQTLAINETKVLVNIVKQQMKDDMETLLKQVEVQSWNNGSGEIGTIASAGISGVAITMTTPFGGTRFIIGGTYSFYAPSSTTPRTGGSVTYSTVVSIVQSTGVVTFDAVPNDIQAGDIVTLPGSYQRAIHGVPYHVNNDSGDYQGQSRGTYPELKATVYDASASGGSARISVAILDRTIALNEVKMGYETNNKDFQLWSSNTQWEAYKQLGYSMIRFNGGGEGAGKFNGTYQDGIKHGSLDWNKAIDCPDDRIYGLRMKDLDWYELEAIQVLKDDSLTMRMIPDLAAGADATHAAGSYKAGFVYYIGGSGEMGAKDPRKHFAITNLATTNLPTRMAA